MGFASEAAQVCIDIAFNTLNLNALYTYTKVDNVPSRRVAEKNGMIYQKEFIKEIDGRFIREVLYKLSVN